MTNLMKNTEKIIATTPLELSKFLGKKKLIITGEWCNENLNNQVEKKKNEIIKHPFENKNLKKKSYFKIIQLYKIFIVFLAKTLNKIHKVKYSTNYWEGIVGVWLIDFLTLFYEKYLVVQKLNNSRLLKVYKFNKEKKFPKNSVQSSNYMNSHEWNNEIFCYLIEKTKKNIIISNLNTETIYNDKIKFNNIISLKSFFKKKIIKFFSLFSMQLRKKNETFIIGSYLTFFDEIKLQQKVNNLIKLNSTPIYNASLSDHSIRAKTPVIKGGVLEKLIAGIIFNHMPKSFLEDYKGIVKFSNELPWSKKPKKIFTAVHNFYDDVFKIWTLEKKRRFNSKFIFCCHGGGFQTQTFSTQNFLLMRTCDKILTWGKNRHKDKKIKSFLNLKSSSKPFDQKKILNENYLKILIPQDLPEMYSCSLFSSILQFSEYKKYVEEQKKFLKGLKSKVRDKVIIRLGSSSNIGSNNNFRHYEEGVWKMGNDNFNLESREIPINVSVNRSYIVIITQVSSTTLLECITSNIPFVIFANLKKQVVNSYFKKILHQLRKDQIFFENPNKLSNFLNQKNASEIQKWWNSKKIQKHIKFLSDNFAIYSKNPVDKLAKELKGTS